MASSWRLGLTNLLKARIQSLRGRIQFYLEVKIERRRLLRLLKSKSHQNVVVVCNLGVFGPQLGDFTNILGLTNILQKNFMVQFVFIDGKRRGDWARFELEQQNEIFNIFYRMASSVVINPTKNVVILKSKDLLLSNFAGSHFVFKSRVARRRGTWHQSSTLSSAIFDKLDCDDEQLFKTIQFKSLREMPTGKFITWHVRKGNILPGLQSTENEFLNQYYEIRKIVGPETNIVLLSSPEGLSDLMPLASKKGLKISSSRDFSADFVGDVSLILRSQLYIQLGNGGMYVAALFSNTPYYMTKNVFSAVSFDSMGNFKRSKNASYSTKAFGVNLRKSRVTSWQSELQVVQNVRLKESPEVVVDWEQFQSLVVKLDLSVGN